MGQATCPASLSVYMPVFHPSDRFASRLDIDRPRPLSQSCERMRVIPVANIRDTVVASGKLGKRDFSPIDGVIE